MRVLSIQYDLYKEPGRVYKGLIEAIKAIGAWCHPTESAWFVQTTKTPEQVIAALKPRLHAKDKVVVTPVALDQGWWTIGLSKEVLDWLRGGLQSRRAG